MTGYATETARKVTRYVAPDGTEYQVQISDFSQHACDIEYNTPIDECVPYAPARAFVSGTTPKRVSRYVSKAVTPSHTRRGDDPKNDDRWQQYNVNEIVAEVEVLRGVLNQLGATEATISWDRYAGCGMCPCSMGFLIDRTVTFDGLEGTTLWISKV